MAPYWSHTENILIPWLPVGRTQEVLEPNVHKQLLPLLKSAHLVRKVH
jgi:hypothetical protein